MCISCFQSPSACHCTLLQRADDHWYMRNIIKAESEEAYVGQLDTLNYIHNSYAKGINSKFLTEMTDTAFIQTLIVSSIPFIFCIKNKYWGTLAGSFGKDVISWL